MSGILYLHTPGLQSWPFLFTLADRDSELQGLLGKNNWMAAPSCHLNHVEQHLYCNAGSIFIGLNKITLVNAWHTALNFGSSCYYLYYFGGQFTQILFVVCPCCYRKIKTIRLFFFSHPKKGVSLHVPGQGSLDSWWLTAVEGLQFPSHHLGV